MLVVDIKFRSLEVHALCVLLQILSFQKDIFIPPFQSPPLIGRLTIVFDGSGYCNHKEWPLSFSLYLALISFFSRVGYFLHCTSIAISSVGLVWIVMFLTPIPLSICLLSEFPICLSEISSYDVIITLFCITLSRARRIYIISAGNASSILLILVNLPPWEMYRLFQLVNHTFLVPHCIPSWFVPCSQRHTQVS